MFIEAIVVGGAILLGSIMLSGAVTSLTNTVRDIYAELTARADTAAKAPDARG